MALPQAAQPRLGQGFSDGNILLSTTEHCRLSLPRFRNSDLHSASMRLVSLWVVRAGLQGWDPCRNSPYPQVTLPTNYS